jgi:tRNA-modifying protein YgfZ
VLKDKLRQLGANFAQFQGAESAADFGNPAAEYHAATRGVALMERSSLGRVLLSGKDRYEFLHRMSSNDLHNLRAGDGLQTVLTTPEARIVDLLTVYVQPETLLCITAPQTRVNVLDWFRRNIFFRDKVKVADESANTVQLSLFGPRAEDVLRRNDSSFCPLPSFHSHTGTIAGTNVLIARVPYIAGGGYDLIAAAADGEYLWDALLASGAAFDLRPIGTTAFNWLRLAAAQPLYGYELSEEHNPLEAMLNHAISFSKGCYTGQEVIARLDTYQKLKQRLSGLHLSDLPSAPLPLAIRVGESDAGSLTSVARLPGDERVIGLGYVRSKFYEPGAPVTVQSDDGAIAGTLVPVHELVGTSP